MPENTSTSPHSQATPFLSASTLVERGFKVFPLVHGGKNPAVEHGFKQATSDRDQVSYWARTMPWANIGIATGRQESRNFFVVDIDVKGDAKGMESLACLRQDIEFPETLMAKTPSGGLHLYFRLPLDTKLRNRTNIMPGIDIRADGGYVVAAPSVIAGTSYEWVDDTVLIAEAPEALIAWAKSRQKKDKDTEASADAVPQGGRNDQLMRLAMKQLKKGASREEVTELVMDANIDFCDPPLENTEVLHIIDNVFRNYEDQRSTHFTDMGNAKRMAMKYGADIRYVVETKQWLIWTGNYWMEINNLDIVAMAKTIPMELHVEADQVADDNLRKEMKRHASASEGALKLQHMIELFKSEPNIAVSIDDLDRNRFLFGVQNGVINLKTGEFKEAKREMLITQVSPVTYDPDATCPLFESFMMQIMKKDKELVEYLQKAVGYSLSGSVSEQCLFFLYGYGANGKSTFLNIVRAVVGDYGAQAAGETLLEQNRSSNGPSEDLARLRGKRFVALSEVDDGKAFAEGLFKSLTGGEPITARRLYQGMFEYLPAFKLFLAANHKPIAKSGGHGFYRRLRLIPFEMTIKKEDQDPQLEHKLREEAPGILNWAIKGCLEWQKHGLTSPKAVVRAIEEYESEMNILKAWMAEYVVVDSKYRASSAELYASFSEWAKSYHSWSWSQNRFGRKLAEHGFKSKKTPKIVYLGLTLRDNVSKVDLVKYDQSARSSGLFTDEEDERRAKFRRLAAMIMGISAITDEESDET
ncbi:bifunctional DNA primase/polymerase [Herbaspirillum sp. AP02]|uniref:phage/plasmid primase, P4 family n=1 Tax=unclassified Herbaspirillum TaxID=2624150 RepID=UPI0015DBC26F|nr:MULTISPECIES: phage/plasmid primase, P4 family [unclassified Herbaspirillum]MBG7619020.1 bifunctional DNA primase/polymerase [Herbaspirillum sp. AP02]NZD66304.1 bifunctional DNA primase/polymerase [Herbaspirillum sp. AP21]